VAQQENAPNKPVHLIYLCGAVLLFYVLQWTVDWVWGYFDPETVPSDFKLSLAAAAIALIAGIAMYRSEKYYTLANEVAGELKKVTWPSTKEVRSATTVVIVMAIVSAVILGIFDFIWTNLTELVYVGR
jgi:preprotein translocase subunit SecE